MYWSKHVSVWTLAMVSAAGLATASFAAQLDEPAEGAVSVTASPDKHAVTRHMTVAYGDLDLTRVRDQRRLEQRVDVAAEAVCSDSGMWDRFAWQDKRVCLDNAVDTAMAQVRGTAGAGAN